MRTRHHLAHIDPSDLPEQLVHIHRRIDHMTHFSADDSPG